MKKNTIKTITHRYLLQMNQHIGLEFYATNKEVEIEEIEEIEEININYLKQKKAPQMHVGHILLRFYFNKKNQN